MSNDLIRMSIQKKDQITIDVDGVFKQKITKKFETDLPSDAIDRIFQNSALLLAHCQSKDNESTDPAVGIMIGKVQSGKTSNFIGLIALSFDNGYDFVVVFGGTKKNLLTQNKERIKGYFDNNDDVHVLSTGDRADESVLDENTLSDLISRRKKFIILTLKHPKHIDKITTLFSKPSTNLSPVMIIDDEGDEATLNTNVFKPYRRKSPIYNSTLELKNAIERCSFISVTATPQANFLINGEDELSPSFGILIEPGDGYCGLSVFHGEDEGKYYRSISEEDVESFDSLENGFPDSFMEAFASFFVGAAIRRHRGDSEKHAMLIHTSSSVDAHGKIAKAVDQLLVHWNSIVKPHVNCGIYDDSFNSLRFWFKRAYDDFKNTCEKIPQYGDLEPYISRAVYDCGKKVLVCNGNQDDSVNQKLYDNNIFIGGNKLQRGITIRGLSTTYMTRRAKNKTSADTTEQRARWFGYRRKHIDVCRLFTTDEIRNDYENIHEFENDFWSRISGWLDEGYDFKDIPRILRMEGKMNFTRTNVARTEKIKFEDWIFQNKVLLGGQNFSNLERSSIFKEEMKPIEKTFANGNTHLIASDVLFSVVYEKFLQHILFHKDEKIGEKIRLMHSMYEDLGKDPRIDIVWIRDGNPQERSTLQNGKINQLFTGASTNYEGDRSISIGRSENLKLQIHSIVPKVGNIHHPPTLAIAIRLSAHSIQDLHSIHVRKGDFNEE